MSKPVVSFCLLSNSFRVKMYLQQTLLVFTLICIFLVPVYSWWPFSSSSSEETGADQGKHLQNNPVPFEMTIAEEKFLADAKKYMGDLTPLDSCHQLVINRIKKSCGDINEEELAKLGVALLNCQSKSEGRRTYECTEDMELRDCTADMDAMTWNSYHIISNRARSICYATRQQQFRLKTEFTVNQLAGQAEEQMHLMNHLQDGQRRLTQAAEDTVIRVSAGQERLINQQRQLHNNYEGVQRSISFSLKDNVRALNHEKTLMDKGRRQLQDMARSIKEKLENATKEIQKQSVDRRKSQRKILEDLNKIRGKAEEVWDKIDDSTLQMVSYHSESAQRYNETMENLKIINETIAYLLQVTNQVQAKIDDRFGWLTQHLEGTGENLLIVTTCLMHAGYFLLATLCILFLNAPIFSRLVLLILVPVNAWSEINIQSSLSFGSLSCLLTLALLGNWLYIYLMRYFQCNKNQHSLPPALGLQVQPSIEYVGCWTRESTPPGDDSYLAGPSDESAALTPSGLVGKTKRQLDLSIPGATSTPSKLTPRRRCGARTRAGSACKKPITNGGFKCTTHSRMEASYILDER
ncbi:protein brambleberry-like [Acropora muricata]|uniref:protein brambleberry-like n=1 Tax=Acropora muricata TaxID=159855 RepID=UPI0034E5BDF2